jgi:hypothetical protein
VAERIRFHLDEHIDPDIAAANSAHSGIVICRRQFLSIREIIRGLILIYEVLTPTEMCGRVEFI